MKCYVYISIIIMEIASKQLTFTQQKKHPLPSASVSTHIMSLFLNLHITTLIYTTYLSVDIYLPN